MEQLFGDNIFARQQKEQQLLYSNKERKQSRNKHEHKSNSSITSLCNFRLTSFIQAGRWDVYIYSPCGVKFASRKKLKGFFEKNNLNYDPEDFDFTPYGRHIDSRAAIAGVAGGGGGGGTGGGGAGGGGAAAAAAAAAAGGSASNAASRHNSSGSTGSDGTQPGSSPASIANYSPTHVHASPYLPQSSFMSMGHAHHAVSAAAAASLVPPPPVPPGGSTMMGAPPSFADYSTVGGGGLGGGGGFAPFDPHMENPPNASALDVPGSFSSVSTASSSSFATSQQDLLTSSSSSSLATATSSSSSSSVYSNHLTLPYHHLGRGHHHPIVKGEHQGAGSEFIPAADMVDILGSGAGSSTTAVAAAAGTGADHSSLHNGGLVGFPSFASSTSTSAAALQPLSNASSAHSRTSEEEDSKSGVLRDVKSEQQQQQQRSSSANSAILGAQGSSSSPSSAAGGGGGGGGGSDPSGAGGDRGGFSLGRTMSVLQSQEGFEEYNFY